MQEDGDLRAKLKGEMQSVGWQALEEFQARSVLIVASSRVDLIEVGARMAEDDRGQIEKWMIDGLVGRPTPEQLERWRSEPQTTFAFLIIQPFVVAQEVVQ